MISEGAWSERTKQVFQRLVNKWIQEGMEKGIQHGLILDAQDMVLSAIEVKLGHVPEHIEQQIKNITDREKLKHLHKEIIKAQEVTLSFLNSLLSN